PGESVVVVRFTVMRQHTDARALLVRMVEIAGGLRAGNFLEQLRVGPLHPAFGQQCFRFVPAAAKPFEQEERFGKFLAHAGGDVLPDRHRHFVTCVAAEAIHAAPAPGEKRLGQVVPKFPFARVQLDQVLPGHAPRAGTEERAILAAQKPLWMPLENGAFLSPGAWGVTWEDLVELNTRERELWDHLAEAFLTWCRRGVDGFRCDAGYKVPMPVWRYIIARVREEFPETLFLLEGLGGGWNETEALLTEGGM